MTPLVLRPVEADDVAPLASLLAHPGLVGRRGLDQDRNVARSATALAKSIERFVDPHLGDGWVVEAGGIVGLATVGWWWDAHTPWAHVVIDPAQQRNGHGSAAARWVFDHLFDTTVAVLIEYEIPSWDAAARSFADSLGGRQTGVRRRVGIRDSRYHDTVTFAMTRERWEERRGAGR